MKDERNLRFFRRLLGIQASYILVTAVWPLIDIESFMNVTGPKRDIWLVKTVGALLIPIAITLYCYLVVDTNKIPAILLGSLTALAFIGIDFYYALNDVISDIYLADGHIELIFLLGWLYIILTRKKTAQPE